MDNNIKILKNYIFYFLVGLLICMVGITDVFADEIIDTSTWINVTGRNWSLTGQEYYSGTQTFNNDVLLNYYNVTGGIYTPPNNYDYITYSYFEHNSSIYNPCQNGKFTSTFKLLFTTPSFVDYVTNVKWNDTNCSITDRNNTSGWLGVTCVSSPSASTYTDIFVEYTTISGTNTSNLYITRNIDVSCSLNTGAIIDNQNQNTQDIINNNNNNTQNIINNNNQNTQEIIDNQNQNSEKEIESQKVCSDYHLHISFEDRNDYSAGYLNSSGDIIRSNNWFYTSNYINITKGYAYNLTGTGLNTGDSSYCLYDNSYNLLNCTSYTHSNKEYNITPTEDGFIRFSFFASYGYYYVDFNGVICQNGNQALNDKLEEQEKTSKGILGKLGELISRLFSNDDADVSGLNNMAGWLPPGPLDSIINLPLNLFQALTSTLSGTCSPVQLTLPFVNKQLTLPCFDAFMSQYLTGFSTIWTFIGVTVSVFILYNYLLTLYKWVDDTLTLRENNLPGYYDDNWGGGA